MHLFQISVPVLVLGLAGCAPPPPEAFDKLPVGATTAAIDAQRAQQVLIDTRMPSAPVQSAGSKQMRQTGRPVAVDLAAANAMALPEAGRGLPLSVGGQPLEVTQVRYDGMAFLVGRASGAGLVSDPSDALKSLAPALTDCQPSGPVWQDGARYAVGLACL